MPKEWEGNCKLNMLNLQFLIEVARASEPASRFAFAAKLDLMTTSFEIQGF
jgi:hypothetical protein